MTYKYDNSLVLDNLSLLDCYLSTNYLTNYLDQIESYKPQQDRYLLPGIRSKSILSERGYKCIISHPSNTLLALSFLYLLLYLDKLDYTHDYLIKYLQINNNKYMGIKRTIREYNLMKILRPSLPYRGLKHKGGYPRSRSGV
jgi:hypothetical protein